MGISIICSRVTTNIGHWNPERPDQRLLIAFAKCIALPLTRSCRACRDICRPRPTAKGEIGGARQGRGRVQRMMVSVKQGCGCALGFRFLPLLWYNSHAGMRGKKSAALLCCVTCMSTISLPHYHTVPFPTLFGVYGRCFFCNTFMYIAHLRDATWCHAVTRSCTSVHVRGSEVVRELKSLDKIVLVFHVPCKVGGGSGGDGGGVQ